MLYAIIPEVISNWVGSIVNHIWSSLKIDRAIRAIGGIKTNAPLIAIGMALLTVLAGLAIWKSSGIAVDILGGLAIVGIIVILFTRTSQSRTLPSSLPAQVQIALIREGYFYGEDGKLISLAKYLGLPGTKANPKQLPPAQKDDME